MNKSKNIVVFRFTEQASAYQALSALKQLAEPSAEVTAAMLVERQPDGAVQVPDGVDAKGGGEGMLLGGLVGSVLGVVGGPVGVVVGALLLEPSGEVLVLDASLGMPASPDNPLRRVRLAATAADQRQHPGGARADRPGPPPPHDASVGRFGCGGVRRRGRRARS